MKLAAAVLIGIFFCRAETSGPPGLVLRKPKIVDLARVSERELNLPNPRPGARRIGIHRAVSASLMRKGQWSSLPGGGKVWRVGIRSPGARGVRVHFTKFTSGTLWVHDGSKDTSGGPYDASNKNFQGEFWSDIIKGDLVIIEYRAGGDGKSDPTFVVKELSHQFESVE